MTGPTTIFVPPPGVVAIQPPVRETPTPVTLADGADDPVVPTGVNETLYRQICAPMTAARPNGLLFPERLQPASVKGWLLAIEGNLKIAALIMKESAERAYNLRADFAGAVKANAWQPPAPQTSRVDLAGRIVRQGTHARIWTFFHNASVEAVGNIRKVAESLGLEELRRRVAGDHLATDESLTDAWSVSDLSIAHLAALDVFDQGVKDAVAEDDTKLMELWRTTKPFMDSVGSSPAISWNG